MKESGRESFSSIGTEKGGHGVFVYKRSKKCQDSNRFSPKTVHAQRGSSFLTST
jgi:hypothetical protein